MCSHVEEWREGTCKVLENWIQSAPGHLASAWGGNSTALLHLHPIYKKKQGCHMEGYGAIWGPRGWGNNPTGGWTPQLLNYPTGCSWSMNASDRTCLEQNACLTIGRSAESEPCQWWNPGYKSTSEEWPDSAILPDWPEVRSSSAFKHHSEEIVTHRYNLATP